MEEKKAKLKKLFFEKKYNELIFEIQTNIEIKHKNTAIQNLLGACITLRTDGKSKEDLIWASKIFKEAYLSGKKTNDGLFALVNFINTSMDIKKDFDIEINFKEIVKFFEEAILFFPLSEKLILAILRVYKYLNNLEMILFYLKGLVKKKNCKISTICTYILYNCYKENQSQKFFLKQAQLLDERLPKYDEKKLVKINKNKNDKIKIGFLSADIVGKHSITYFLKTILLKYDKKKYEIFLFLNNIKQDQTTNIFKELVDKSFNIKDLNDIEAINLIRQNNIDIIIDLMGIMSENRIALLKNRLAPAQISWLGYCNTTGLKNMDYIISDRNLIHSGEEKLYTEKIIFLPKIWNCHAGFDLEIKSYPTPFKNNKYITFGSFNNFNKINLNVVEVWSKILKNVKNSKLILKSSRTINIDKLKELFKKNDVLESVSFLERNLSFEEHLRLYQKIDIGLDTFPYNGVTTSFEAIWMNVPILTMKGFNFNSRCGESINKNIGINYLIAKDEREYIDKAIELSKDVEKLTRIRNKIFNEVASSSLFDKKKFSLEFFKSLETAYNQL
jgi:predicted O-linked N-acetylglucosamine transferase (SPINDLY family)